MKQELKEILIEFCDHNRYPREWQDDTTLMVTLPSNCFGLPTKTMLVVQDYPEQESVKVSFSLGRAYGSKLNQALRLNNILSKCSLSVIRYNGEDHFNLIYWEPMPEDRIATFNLNPIIEEINEELSKVKQLIYN